MDRDGQVQASEAVGKLERLYAERAIGRREFMGALLALGVSLPGAAMLGTDAAQAQAIPRRGGRVRYAHDSSGPADTLDPILGQTHLDQARARIIYSSLFRLNEKLGVDPEIAEEYAISPDGLQYKFKIRKGVEFHDGKPLTADDVVYSMNRHVGGNSASRAKVIVEDVVEWKKVDAQTVVVDLRRPNVELPIALGTSHFKLVREGTTDFSKPIGSGPFRVQEFSPGIRLICSRFENYWVQGRPYVDEIETFSIPDPGARANALITGDVNLIGNVDPKVAKQIQDAKGVSLMRLPTASYPSIAIMTDRGPGVNTDFRLGMKYLQRRADIVKGLYGGNAEIGNDHPISSAYSDFSSDIPLRGFDPDKAKYHLGKSGVSKAIMNVANVNAGIVEQCLFLQNEARKIGFNLEIVRVPNDGYWTTHWIKQDIMVGRWNMRPTALLIYQLGFSDGAGMNETRMAIPRFGRVVSELRGERDPARRKELHREAQMIIHEESGDLIAAFPDFVDAKSDKLQGMTKIPLMPVGGSEWPEFVWFDA